MTARLGARSYPGCPTFVFKARDGTELKVALADNALIVAIVKASLSDIKPGSFVGVTGMPQPDGTQRAIEVHIFPESMRGTGTALYLSSGMKLRHAGGSRCTHSCKLPTIAFQILYCLVIGERTAGPPSAWWR